MIMVTVDPDLPPPTPTSTGRPRDARIDGAVLEATIDLLEEVGYLQLTIAAIAERAGTTKPAIYRRWPSKAHLVHEAVFPAQDPESIPVGDDLSGEIAGLVRIGLELLGRPAARAALPGLLAETTNDPSLLTDVFGRAAGGTWVWLQQRIDRGIAAGEVRADVETSMVFELIAATAFIATTIRPMDQIGPDWVDGVVDLIMRGITA